MSPLSSPMQPLYVAAFSAFDIGRYVDLQHMPHTEQLSHSSRTDEEGAWSMRKRSKQPAMPPLALSASAGHADHQWATDRSEAIGEAAQARAVSARRFVVADRVFPSRLACVLRRTRRGMLLSQVFCLPVSR